MTGDSSCLRSATPAKGTPRTTYGWRFGETRVFKRPDWYYDPKNPDNPETIELTRVRPNIFPELTDDELFDKLMQRCREIQLAKQYRSGAPKPKTPPA